MPEPREQLKKLQRELKEIDRQRKKVALEVQKLQAAMTTENVPEPGAPVHAHSPEEEKIRLFRSLFSGRDDVFPRRFKSRKNGRSGYQPACENE